MIFRMVAESSTIISDFDITYSLCKNVNAK